MFQIPVKSWMKIPGDTRQNYIVRLEFIPGSTDLLTQQLNRKQNASKLYISESATGNSRAIYQESDSAWVDIYQPGNRTRSILLINLYGLMVQKAFSGIRKRMDGDICTRFLLKGNPKNL